MNTINNAIPFVPENTIDPAAGLNLSLNTIDALLQVLVQSVGENAPPVATEGQRFIVGTAPTGAWAGQANKLARWIDGAWQFFDARYALNAGDGQWYGRSGSTWAQLGGGSTADGSITNVKLANMATQTIKGRATAGTGAPEDLTAAQVRELLDLVVGTDIQAQAANLSALAGLVGAADKGVHFTGTGTMAIHEQTAFARTLMDDADAATARGTLGLGSGDSPTLAALTLTNGQISFPPTQVPSTNPNVLDDYEEGTWTPILTFSTPGNLSVSYATQTGLYTKIGNRVLTDFLVETSSFSYTTATGNCRVSGFPFTIGSGNGPGPLRWSGVTKPGHTTIAATGITGTGNVEFRTSGSGVTTSNLVASDMPSGGFVLLFGQLTVV